MYSSHRPAQIATVIAVSRASVTETDLSMTSMAVLGRGMGPEGTLGSTQTWSAPASTAAPTGVSEATLPSINQRSPMRTGGNMPGIADDAASAGTAGPVSNQHFFPGLQVGGHHSERQHPVLEPAESSGRAEPSGERT